MKTRYFVQTNDENNSGLIWRKIGNKIEYTCTHQSQEWKPSAFKTLRKLKHPQGSLSEVAYEELALLI